MYSSIAICYINDSETWNITGRMEKKIYACESNLLVRIPRISYKDHITNEEVR